MLKLVKDKRGDTLVISGQAFNNNYNVVSLSGEDIELLCCAFVLCKLLQYCCRLCFLCVCKAIVHVLTVIFEIV